MTKLIKEPTTHKKTVTEMQTVKGLLKVLEIGIRYHNNRYTPETAHFVSLNGYGKRFTGKKSLLNALACYNSTREQIERIVNEQLVNQKG
jgi:hypothetical protein